MTTVHGASTMRPTLNNSHAHTLHPCARASEQLILTSLSTTLFSSGQLSSESVSPSGLSMSEGHLSIGPSSSGHLSLGPSSSGHISSSGQLSSFNSSSEHLNGLQEKEENKINMVWLMHENMKQRQWRWRYRDTGQAGKGLTSTTGFKDILHKDRTVH